MAIRIIEIAPKIDIQSADPVVAHISIKNFKWVNEQGIEKGVSSLETMFDWIVNRKGQAYVKSKENNITVPVFGAISPSGHQYLRCLKDGKWSDELLELDEIK